MIILIMITMILQMILIFKLRCFEDAMEMVTLRC